MDDKIMNLLNYFEHNGLLLCNVNSELPSLETVGGDWDAIVTLMEQGRVFYSKLYKGRVTYLSAELYYALKPHKQCEARLSAESRRILQFVRQAGRATTAEIKNAVAMPKKDFDKAMDGLFKGLLLTATARDRTLAASWSSFYWGSFEAWEGISPHKPRKIDPRELLSGIMTPRQIDRLLAYAKAL